VGVGWASNAGGPAMAEAAALRNRLIKNTRMFFMVKAIRLPTYRMRELIPVYRMQDILARQ